ncbi:MAG: 50S ribosomal protein L21 [Solirubrobacterales bacterium]|nr:50S ribosomal protein L21 [Solirubrobacterales bacterium]
MYAVVESGGKQYRVEEGTVLLVDRLKAEEGETVALKPVMVSSDGLVVDAKSLEKIKIEATVTGHERGEKIRVFKYKAKKGYSRRQGHRSELTRLEVTSLGGSKKKATPKKAAAKQEPEAEAGTAEQKSPAKKPAAKKAPAKKPAAKPAAKAAAETETTAASKKPAAKKATPKKPAATKEETDGA